MLETLDKLLPIVLTIATASVIAALAALAWFISVDLWRDRRK